MPNETAVIVSDVHLGHAPEHFARSFHRFLERVPDLGTHLVINGDLFDFWFEYRSVIPRRAFPTLSRLARLRAAGVAVTMTGGNHDRWGGRFWRDELDASFHPDGVTLTLAGWTAHVTHGDGLTEQHLAARMMHRVTRWRMTAWVFRWLHPDLGLPLVDAMSHALADRTRDPEVLRRVADGQEAYARRYLEAHHEIDLLVMGHTHRPALAAVSDGRWYVNPGAWIEGDRYAIVGPEGPRLCGEDA